MNWIVCTCWSYYRNLLRIRGLQLITTFLLESSTLQTQSSPCVRIIHKWLSIFLVLNTLLYLLWQYKLLLRFHRRFQNYQILVLRLEVVESYNDHCHVVQRTPKQSIFDDVLDSQPDLLVDVLRLRVFHGIPNTLNGLLVGDFVENSVTCQHYEIVLRWDSEWLDVGKCNDNIGVAPSLFQLRLDVSESSANRETPW